MSTEKNLLAFIASKMQVQVHQHLCYQIILSLNRPFRSEIAGDTLEAVQCLLVNQEVAHDCRALESDALIYFIDPTSQAGWRVQQLLQDRPYWVLPVDDPDIRLHSQHLAFAIQLSHAPQGPLVKAAADVILTKLLAPQAGAATKPIEPKLDPRIELATAFIEQHLDKKINLSAVAKVVNLSSERTRHFFTESMGSPFSQYVLWRRLNKGIALAVHKKLSLTEAAVQAGFSDQAHFCRLFKRTFGVVATGLLKNSRYVQFIYPTP
jgi:AraC-like DNA-binding protein